MRGALAAAAFGAVMCMVTATSVMGAGEILSHPPMRPPARLSARPMAEGPAFFVDPAKGNDANDGSRGAPWKTLQHAVWRLSPGVTLYLRGGAYYEHVYLTQSGAPDKPITIRSYPGETAILDGGLREFYENHAGAWQPCPDGAEGEYVSTKTYPNADRRIAPNQFMTAAWEPMHGKEEDRPLALGHFGDSMVPLHGYRWLYDLRATNELWVKDKYSKQGVYCGPGLWYDRKTGLIHVRLAHTKLEGLGDKAYRGVADPRRIPLVVAVGFGEDVLRITGVRHVRFQDIVLRGATGGPLISIYDVDDIEFDHVTTYGGFPNMLINASARVRIFHSAFRTLGAPWSSRAHMKYRGTASYALITQGNKPENHDFEIAYSEFTDGHDCVWLRHVTNLKFHHNYVDNFNDDGVEVGAKKRDRQLFIYENLLCNCNMTLTLHEMEPDESPADVNPGEAVYVCRNVIDLRGGIYSSPPAEPDPTGDYTRARARLCSEHGCPIWPLYRFYHNTVIGRSPLWPDHYAFGLGGRGIHGNMRWVFNNIFVLLEGLPGTVIANVPGYQMDGNMHWGVKDGPGFKDDFFAGFRGAGIVEKSQASYAPGWMANDIFADPRFKALSSDWRRPCNVAIEAGSPAVDAGVPIPAEWPDPLRQKDSGRPDIGALPLGVEGWGVGVDGRIPVSRGRTH